MRRERVAPAGERSRCYQRTPARGWSAVSLSRLLRITVEAGHPPGVRRRTPRVRGGASPLRDRRNRLTPNTRLRGPSRARERGRIPESETGPREKG